MMQVEEIAARLEQSFDLLTGGSRTALPRYQSLHASIDWSYNLLSETERLLFRRLAVFAGSWNMDEARFIASGDAISREPEESSQFPEDVLELLTLLVNKSLVTPHQLPGAPTRYFYLDSIRNFAFERLRETGEELLMRNRHLDYYELLGSRLEPLLRGADMVTTLTSLEADHDNLRTALEWSLATDLPAQFERSSRTNVEKGLRLVGDLVWFWVLLFIADEGIMWAKRLLAAEVIERGLQPLNPLRDLARARALYMIGWYGDGESAQSQKYMEESLRILKELGSVGRRDAAYALNALAEWTLGSGEYERAKALANESLDLFREVGDLPGLTMVLGSPFASLAMNQGDFDLARKYMDEALAINQNLGDMDGVAEGYRRLGELAALEGNCRQAWTLLENAHELYCRLGNKLGIYFTLVQMGKAALAQGDAKHAEAIFAEALDLARQVGALSQMSASMATLGKAAFVQGQYERASQWYRQAIETAREIEDNRALACALRGLAEVNQAGGDAASALRLYQESLEVWGELVDRREIYRSLEALAALVVDLGQPELSLRLFAATQDLYNSIRFSFSPRHQDMHSNKLNSLKSQLGEAAFNAAWSQGQAMELEQAIETALSFSIS